MSDDLVAFLLQSAGLNRGLVFRQSRYDTFFSAYIFPQTWFEGDLGVIRRSRVRIDNYYHRKVYARCEHSQQFSPSMPKSRTLLYRPHLESI
jgi:hypothetical protein